ncbi:hypothetical protein [Fusobacterium sp.]|uniref:hypothetical protein n=1 Tax=Fusobacterium sp. TaxID=68766 RepID=UPI0025C4D4D8|nr:hypothetical protein [Fusobacterium sp.]
MRGGARQGAGRHPKDESNKKRYITKTIKFKKEEEFILKYIDEAEGKNFSEKLKKIIVEIIEKK